MPLNTRSTPVLGITSTAPDLSSARPSAGRTSPRSPRPPAASFQYFGIAPPARIPWLAMLVSAGLHALLLLGFNQHAPIHKVRVVEEPVEQLQMMPILDDPEEKKVKDLDDDQPETTPAVSVPMLADLPTLVPVDNSFTQVLDLTIPLKSDPNAGSLIAIPVNIQHGKLDENGIKNLFNISELDRRPEAIVQISPNYPFEMKRQGVSARVQIRFIVDVEGNVIRPMIAAATHTGFERAAIEAILRWKFKPGMKNGRRVNTRVEQPMDFNVDKDS